MANYTKVFTKPYANGYEDLPSQNTPITAETLNDKDDTLEHIEDYLYDNPIAEVVDNLTSNDATKALSAKQGKVLNDTKLNVADLPNSDVQTSNDGQFTTVTGGLMQSCVVDLEPIQDLHGYSKPWTGGSGKNKLNYNAWKNVDIIRGTAVFENNGVTLTATANDCYTGYATDFSTDARIPISEGETVTLSWKETSNKSGTVMIFPNGEVAGVVTVNNANAKSLSYTATSGVTFVTFRFGVQNSGNTIEYKDIQIEKGSQATTFEPYSNICPISGHTQVDVWNDPKFGKPITWNQLVQNGNFTSTSNWGSHSASLSVSNNIMKVTLIGAEWNNDLYQNLVLPKSHKILYTFKYRMSAGLSSNAIAFQQGNYTLGGNLPYSNSFVTIARIVQTVTNDTQWIRVTIANNGATLSGQYFEVQDFNIIDLTQLFGTTIADYIYNLEQATTGAGVAYFRNLFPKDYYDYNSGEFTCVSAVNGDTCIQTTINLGGTYYGGTLDAVSGKLTVTHGLATFNGDNTVNRNYVGSSVTQFLLPQLPTDAKIGSTLSVSNELVYSDNTNIPYIFQITRAGTSTPKILFTLPNSIATTIEEASAWLASNPLQIAYELATPTTIQLTPTQLETLVGQNDVFAPLEGQTLEEVEFREVLAIDDVVDAIPYESVDPIQVDWFTIFKIHRYGRVVVLKFDDISTSPVVSEDGWAILGRLPERFYHKYPNQMVAENMIFGVINNDNGTLQMKKLIIDQYNGDVKIYFLANEQINPLGSITYILDHD